MSLSDGATIAALLGEALTARLQDVLTSQPVERNLIFAFPLETGNQPGPLDVLLHTIDGTVILEFEAHTVSAANEPDYYALVKQTVSRLYWLERPARGHAAEDLT